MTHKILLADDDEAIRLALSMNLEQAGFIVVCAEDGQIALEKFQSEPFDAAVIDMRMPNLNGVETVRAIRKINIYIPIFIITAFFQEFETGLKKLQDENFPFELVRKPVHPDTLITALQNSII